MPLDHERLTTWAFDPVEQAYSQDDCILYALGVGFGYDPTDPRQLRFTYEEALQPVPTMPVVLGRPDLMHAFVSCGVNWNRMLHGEQRLRAHGPLPPAGIVRGLTRVDEVVDKGVGRGAVVYVSRDVREGGTDRLISTQTSTLFLRDEGGFGGAKRASPPPAEVPSRPSDELVDVPTVRQAALIYRLSGDRNPLHVDPRAASRGGFSAPILHGLCTYGIAGHAVLRALCDYEPDRLQELNVRFTSPALPGETIRTEIWTEQDEAAVFRSSSVERAVGLLDGYCGYRRS